jgi:hypothetical protein
MTAKVVEKTGQLFDVLNAFNKPFLKSFSRGEPLK